MLFFNGKNNGIGNNFYLMESHEIVNDEVSEGVVYLFRYPVITYHCWKPTYSQKYSSGGNQVMELSLNFTMIQAFYFHNIRRSWERKQKND